MMELDSRSIEHELARKLAVIMSNETEEAFKSKVWNGVRWAPVRVPNPKGSLMIRDSHLRNSLSFAARGNVVAVSSSMPYASLHNEGGRVVVPVTDKMRRYWWWQYRKSGGRDVRYKAMALSRKSQWTICVPQRQFVGVTGETDRQLEAQLDEMLGDLDIRL